MPLTIDRTKIGALPVIGIVGDDFYVNGRITFPGTQAEGRLPNVRMANALFEDTNINPSFDAEANSDRFISMISSYMSCGVLAFSISLQGGNPGYENAICTAINANGSLKTTFMDRAARVITAIGQRGGIVMLNIYYQRQDQHVTDQTALETGVVNVANWIVSNGFRHVLLEIANEHTHTGYNHASLLSDGGTADLIDLAKTTQPSLFVSASGLGDGALGTDVKAAAHYLAIHFNDTLTGDYDTAVNALVATGKPIVCNEDPKGGETGDPQSNGVTAAQAAFDAGASWGYFKRSNQDYPFDYSGWQEAVLVYNRFYALTH